MFENNTENVQEKVGKKVKKYKMYRNKNTQVVLLYPDISNFTF